MSSHGVEFLGADGRRTARLMIPNQLAAGRYQFEADTEGLVRPSPVPSKPYILLGNAPAPSIGNFPLAANTPLELPFAYLEGNREMLNDANPTRILIPEAGVYDVTGFFVFRNSTAAYRNLTLRALSGFVFGRTDAYIPATTNRPFCVQISGKARFVAGSRFMCTATSSAADTIVADDINSFQLQVAKI